MNVVPLVGHNTVQGAVLGFDDVQPTREQHSQMGRLVQEARLQGVRCSRHTFRHTSPKNLLLSGGDVFTLQKILGHSRLAVVRMRVDLASEDVQIQHRGYSPVDWMKPKI